jgi:hypothetical protein
MPTCRLGIQRFSGRTGSESRRRKPAPRDERTRPFDELLLDRATPFNKLRRDARREPQALLRGQA